MVPNQSLYFAFGEFCLWVFHIGFAGGEGLVQLQRYEMCGTHQ